MTICIVVPTSNTQQYQASSSSRFPINVMYYSTCGRYKMRKEFFRDPTERDMVVIQSGIEYVAKYYALSGTTLYEEIKPMGMWQRGLLQRS